MFFKLMLGGNKVPINILDDVDRLMEMLGVGVAMNQVSFRVGGNISREVRKEALFMLSGPHKGKWDGQSGPTHPFSKREPRVAATGYPAWKIHSESGDYRLKSALRVQSKRVNQHVRDIKVDFGDNPPPSVDNLHPLGPAHGKSIVRPFWKRLASRVRQIIYSEGAR